MEGQVIDFNYIKALVENLLFVAKKPVTMKELKKVTDMEETVLKDALTQLQTEYETRGLQVANIAGGYQLCTRHDYAEFIDKLVNAPLETTLSPAAMETLAIIAYRQPITRSQIDNIRGVISDGVVRTLLDKDLITDAGKSENIGHATLYATTEEFLKHFGLNSVHDLPKIKDGGGEDSDFRPATLLSLEKLEQSQN